MGGALLVALALLVAPGADADPCSTTPTAGLEPRRVGQDRYLLSVPPGLTRAAPLLMSLHGAWMSPEQEAAMTAWHVHARGHVVVYPQSPQGVAWHSYHGSADVDHLREVVGDVTRRYCVDLRRIHVTGFSSGGGMAQRLACDAADLFASVGSVAPFPGNPHDCAPRRPASVAIFQGTEDRTSEAYVSQVGREEWGHRLGCRRRSGEELADGELVELTACAGGTQVLWRDYVGEDHFGPWVKKGDDVRTRHLQFFAEHWMRAT